jgi:hypothetical protein
MKITLLETGSYDKQHDGKNDSALNIYRKKCQHAAEIHCFRVLESQMTFRISSKSLAIVFYLYMYQIENKAIS